jgi:membrane fusion protein (multidrug efflux system)
MNDAVQMAPDRKFRLNKRLVLLVGIPLVALIGVGALYLSGGRYIATDNAYVAAQKVIVTPSVAGRIISLAVSEGQHVNPGDALFVVDPSSYDLIVKQAEAHLSQTVTGFETLGITLQSLNRQIALAKETLDLRQADMDRKLELLGNKAASRNDVDNAMIALSSARTGFETLSQQRSTTLAQLQGNPELPLANYAPYLEAKAARDSAMHDRDATTVRAPIAGVATQVSSVQLGRYLTAGTPVFALVEDQHPWVLANPKETDLTFVHEGQPVSITVDAYPGRVWHGKVASLSPGTGAEFAVLPPQNASGNWVKVVQRVPVRIEFSDADQLHDLRSGMSVQVEIDTGRVRTFLSIFGLAAVAHVAEQ